MVHIIAASIGLFRVCMYTMMDILVNLYANGLFASIYRTNLPFKKKEKR